MNDAQPIAIPAQRRWRSIRKRWLPALFFISTTALCGVLWRHQTGSPALVGEVKSVRVTLSSPLDGVFAGFAPIAGRRLQVYDTVRTTDRVAHLDAGRFTYELNQLLEEVHSLQSEAESGSIRCSSAEPNSDDQVIPSQPDSPLDTCPYLMELNRCQAIAVRIEVIQKELELRQFDMQLEDLQAQGTVSTLDEPEIQRLHEERTQRDSAIRQLRDNLQSVPDRTEHASTEHEVSPEERVLLNALCRRSEECLSRLNTLESEARLLDLFSPIQGVISATYVETGQVLQRGTRIATVVADRATHIVSYIPENEGIRPVTGMRVIVRPRRIGAAGMPSVIEAVGPQVESIPSHQRRYPNMPAWGLPARIPIPDKLVVEPGALVDVILRAGE